MVFGLHREFGRMKFMLPFLFFHMHKLWLSHSLSQQSLPKHRHDTQIQSSSSIKSLVLKIWWFSVFVLNTSVLGFDYNPRWLMSLIQKLDERCNKCVVLHGDDVEKRWLRRQLLLLKPVNVISLYLFILPRTLVLFDHYFMDLKSSRHSWQIHEKSHYVRIRQTWM